MSRVTSLYVKRPVLNRLSYWLYERFCGEPFFPEGRLVATVVIGNPKCLGWDGRENHITLTFIPKRFVPGMHTKLINQNDMTIVDINKL